MMMISPMTYAPGTAGRISDTFMAHLGDPAGSVPGVVLMQVTPLIMLVGIVLETNGFEVRFGNETLRALFVPAAQFMTDAPLIPVRKKTGYRVHVKVEEEWKDFGGVLPLACNRYLTGEMPSEVAKMYGITRQHLHGSCNRLLARLRDEGYEVNRVEPN